MDDFFHRQLAIALADGSRSGVSAAEWPQFRGPGGAGVGLSAVPLTWSDTANLKWKMPLPGPGSSSPIVQGDRVFVTCYSGGGAGAATLTRHLVCVRKADGRLARSRVIVAGALRRQDLRREPVERHVRATRGSAV